ncbi:MAG: DUF2007 domain-containing protein [Proteobacteria bacterium]|nr:DUF2007 domain-containing protein [Pseudomonadota bacterium]
MELVEVFSSHDSAEARLIAEALKQHGLQPAVFGEGLAATVGMSGFVLPARVMVPAEEADEARVAIAVIEEMENEERTEGEPEVCPACGAKWEPGFFECWQCQHEIS